MKKEAMVDISYTQNRELSWLKFNNRVLEEAEDETVPYYERLKFIAIFTNNLAEFFMIRVGSLFDIASLNKDYHDNKSMMSAEEQLEQIFPAVTHLYQKRDNLFASIENHLRSYGIMRLHFHELTTSEQNTVFNYFFKCIAPILSPQIIDFHHPFPHLDNQSLYIAVLLKVDKEVKLGIIPIPKALPEMFFLQENSLRYILLSEIISACVGQIFSMYSLIDKAIICLTRDADINLDTEPNEENEDYPQHIKKALKKRRRLAPVRLEMETDGDSLLAKYLCSKLCISDNQAYITRAPIHLDYVFSLKDKIIEQHNQIDNLSLFYPSFTPRNTLCLDDKKIFDYVHDKDLLLHYPYENFDSFLQLIKEAAYDEKVLSIKITIYRMGSHRAKLMNYLIVAAELGKEVTVIMELRARFDESNNINWAENLREAGCNIIYGFKKYKIHAKICLITRSCNNKIQYITQIGTGNYNSQTASLYTDFALITADQEIGHDANNFFKNMCIANLKGHYKKLLTSPFGLKPRLLELISSEAKKSVEGKQGRILFKMNSLTDRDIIDALVSAAQKGVKVEMIIRGICCLLPGIQKATENITVVSVVGRFLEHSRVFCFGSGEDLNIYISSADLMTRNMNNRVEIACPISSAPLKRRIYNILKVMLSDNTKLRILQSDGNYIKKDSNLSNRNCQEYFMDCVNKYQ